MGAAPWAGLMHELSVCLALIDQVSNIATERDAPRVSKIVIQVGPLSGVEPDLLRHAYPLAAAGTAAEGAELIIDVAAVVVRCSQCERESEVPPNRLVCLHCGDYRTRVLRGDELFLQSLELETGLPERASPIH
jgi:hydrogenase nickel incorporation protein HypA/HybF